MILYSKLEKWEQELKQEGFEKGVHLEKINTAKELLLIGTDIRFIEKITKLSLEEIEKIKNTIETQTKD